MGPSFIGRHEEFQRILFPPIQSPVLITLARLGVLYFVFIVALKMDVVTTLRAAKRCWRFGVVPLFSSYLFTTIISVLCMIYGNIDKTIENLPNIAGLISFAVVSEALLELNLITTELGQIALSSAMVNEIIQWAMLLIVFILTSKLVFSIAFVVCFFSFIILCVFVVRPIMKLIIQRTPIGKPVKEGYIVLILLGVLAMSAISDSIGITFIAGPTLYGLVIPNGPPLATTIIEKCEVVISELILPFFFVFIGINTNLRSIKNWRLAMIFEGIILAGYLAKVLACVVVAATYKIRPKHGLVLGLMLCFKGIVDLIFLIRLKRDEVIIFYFLPCYDIHTPFSIHASFLCHFPFK